MLNHGIQGNVVMGVSNLYNISDFADLHTQQIRKLSITIEVYNKEGVIIGTLHGYSTDGSLDISGESLIRRTGNINLVLVEELLPEDKKLLWITNKIRVYAGIEDMSSANNTVTHFCLGQFYISDNAISVSPDSRTINISLEDYMMRWDIEPIENMMVYEAGTPLNVAVASLMELYGEFNHRISFTPLVIPYRMEFPAGTSVLDILTQLRDLYMDWHCYYHVDGTFIFERIEIQKEYGVPTMWNFANSADLITSFSTNFNFKNVRNRVIVMGEMDEGGNIPRSEAYISLEDSPFHKDHIGERKSVFVESNLRTAQQCDAKARFELQRSSTYQEQVNLSTIPIYFLDAGHVIALTNYATNEEERYVINSMTIGLSVDGDMQINASKLYYDHFHVDSDLSDYQEWANTIVNGITNNGWLHLGEDLIREYYGIEAEGTNELIVSFKYQGEGGITAGVTGSTHSRSQSLTIDLADYKDLVGDSGSNGNKADLLDRVLAHEMVHAVMNDVYTVARTSVMPAWFKEGVAEFIHGADERLLGSIANQAGTGTDIAKRDEIINIAVNLLEGARLQALSDHYSASYVICSFLNRQWLSGKSIKNLFHSLRTMGVKEAIVENTDYATFEDFIDHFRVNAGNHIQSSMTFNYGQDEVDTGSVAGSDHGGVNLNAENVVDNSLAVRGLLSRNFRVEIRGI